MKKTLKFRAALAIVASLLLVNGINAQILTDYQNVAETSYQTDGATFRLYVEPDAIYSPTYNPATNGNIAATARWTWTFAGLSATAPVVSGNAVAQNYVEFTNPTAGSYTIDVFESNILNVSCTGSPVSQDVIVIAAPTAAITTADPTQACGDQLAMAVNMSITEAVPVAFAGYSFAINELVENIDASDAVTATLADNDGFVDFPTNGKLNSGNASFGGANPNYTYTFNTSALTIQNGLRTRYTYTLIKASDAPGITDGIISAISQKSNYIDGNKTYVFNPNNQIVIIVNPSPSTGPIFHIPNDWAY
jgi:hypothetical protein